MGNESKIHQLNAKDFVDEQFGLPTVNDIFKELENQDATHVVNSKRQLSWMAWKTLKIYKWG